jgi:hypothetical protein
MTKTILPRPFTRPVLVTASALLALVSWNLPTHAEPEIKPPAAHSTAGVVPDFALIDHQGAYRHLYYYAKDATTKAIVLFVQGNGCPLVQKRVPQLKRLRDTYAAKGVIFWMINANTQDARDDVMKEATEFKIDLPILLDPAQVVARSLHLTRTAEAIVIQPGTWKILYRGALDDRLQYEAQHSAAQHDYLTAALDAALDGRAIATASTPAPGCVITYPASSPPSYTKTIAPLLQENCVRCHVRGGIGPFAMSSYEKVRGWSEMIREVVLTRRMPPWQADPHFGKFGNDFSLSPDNTRKLIEWIDAGSPRGDGPDPLASHQPALPEWTLGRPDYIVEIPEQSVPAEGVFDYRYITVKAPNDKTVWLRATETKPGNTRILHHIIASIVMPGEDRNKNGRPLAGYAPGMGPDRLPPGTGIRLPAGAEIVFQLHYTASGRAESDRSRLGLFLSPEPPERELRSSVLMDTNFKIPPGEREFVTRKSRRFERDALLYTMNPHMHLRGKSMRYIARYPDGTEETLLNVPNYRFDWQRNYEFKEPKRLPKGTELVVEAAWDNSPLNLNNPDPTQTVGWGDQTFNEMFFASYRYIYPESASPAARAARESAKTAPAATPAK